jgi:hypothetical protein
MPRRPARSAARPCRAPRARARAGGRRVRPARALAAHRRPQRARLAGDAARHHRSAASVGRRHHPTPTSDLDLDRNRVLRANREAWSTRLRELAPIDELAAYAWLAFTCGATEARDLTLDQIAEPAATFKDTPLIGFRRAICRGIETEPLVALREHDARFGEVPYYLGLFAVGQRKLDEADRRFEEAYAWRTQWPSLTQSIANVAMTAEEFERR